MVRRVYLKWYAFSSYNWTVFALFCWIWLKCMHMNSLHTVRTAKMEKKHPIHTHSVYVVRSFFNQTITCTGAIPSRSPSGISTGPICLPHFRLSSFTIHITFVRWEQTEIHRHSATHKTQSFPISESKLRFRSKPKRFGQLSVVWGRREIAKQECTYYQWHEMYLRFGIKKNGKKSTTSITIIFWYLAKRFGTLDVFFGILWSFFGTLGNLFCAFGVSVSGLPLIEWFVRLHEYFGCYFQFKRFRWTTHKVFFMDN